MLFRSIEIDLNINPFATAVEHGVLSEQCKRSNGLLRAVGTGGEI